MINREDMLELTRRMTPARTSMTRVAGCYIDREGEFDGSFNTMSMESVYLQEFLAGEDEDYFAVFVENGGKGIMLCRYLYDPDMAAVPPVTLTVYGLKENATVRQTAVLFQKEHPDVRVEVLNGADQDGNVSEDTIRALNTEILGGRGADVFHRYRRRQAPAPAPVLLL